MVIKFLLNGFIATRQDPFKVSRKTFNPILCEIFRCKWDLSAERDQNAHFESIRPAEEDLYDKFGMMKRNNDHTVTFIGEQVSHNPPISSFYIEGENITATGTIEVNFNVKMGWSPYVKIENKGKILVTIKNREELYEIKLPDNEIYDPIGENPKLSLAGKASIKQYDSNSKLQKSVILDYTKGQGKSPEKNNWHRVEIIINRMPDCKRILKIEGAWDGVLNVTERNDVACNELFMDMNNFNLTKKIIAPFDKMHWLESRRVWRKVIKRLMLNDDKLANEEKEKIEIRQRQVSQVPHFFKEIKMNEEYRSFSFNRRTE